MNSLKFLKIYLFVSGLLLSIIGTLTAFNPVKIKANEGIEIAGNASALNDVRSFGILLIATAILAFSGALKTFFTKTASIAIPLLFIALGVGRIISIILDGMPSDGMAKATVLEIILGTIGIALYSINKNKYLEN
ncbi:DUF4345 domain-containing protein [Tenacibaculum agarivorans]|uniref:DUF4345 domain-containing protein n=1 Tax=Tenacibaculum agarivorans TaxID=1908389 RepID=UPI00094B8A73|nr:DUF4345 domain-containing protein [Tenacibaculum agarivorans]